MRGKRYCSPWNSRSGIKGHDILLPTCLPDVSLWITLCWWTWDDTDWDELELEFFIGWLKKVLSPCSLSCIANCPIYYSKLLIDREFIRICWSVRRIKIINTFIRFCMFVSKLDVVMRKLSMLLTSDISCLSWSLLDPTLIWIGLIIYRWSILIVSIVRGIWMLINTHIWSQKLTSS